LSKFTALFLVAGVALAMVAVPSLRHGARKPWPYLTALAATAIFSPFLAWNAAHGWMTFAKQFGRVPASAFRPGYLLEFLAAQFGLANPLLVVAATAAPPSPPRRLLLAYVAPAALYFLVHALHDRVQGNWTAPLFPALAMLMGEAAAAGPRWAQRLGKAGIALGAVALAATYLHVATGWPALGAADPLARIGGWRELAREVDAEAREQGAAFVLARGYAARSLLTYYGDGLLPVAQSEDPERWIFAPPPALSRTTPGLAFGEAGRGYGAELGSKFRSVTLVGRLARRRGGAEVGEFELFRVGDPIGDLP
jgi:hypothetical protein